jgi:hypothetical protein
MSMKQYAETLTPITQRFLNKWESLNNQASRETVLVNYSDMFSRAIQDMINDGKLNPVEFIPYIQKYGNKYFPVKE